MAGKSSLKRGKVTNQHGRSCDSVAPELFGDQEGRARSFKPEREISR